MRRGNSRRRGQQRTVQQYEYNARGQIVGIIDGNHDKVTYDVDGWGRITGTDFSDSVKERYEYTPAGQVSKTTDGNGNIVQYRYNSLGKVRERIDQLGYAETFQYDEEGNMVLHTDRDGRQVRKVKNHASAHGVMTVLADWYMRCATGILMNTYMTAMAT